MSEKRMVEVFSAREEVRELILLVAETLECGERYRTSGFAEGYYVDLPRYVQRLLDSGERGRAIACLSECFSKGFIPVRLWRAMELLEGRRQCE